MKRITFRQLMNTFNFRDFFDEEGEIEDTEIIRIHMGYERYTDWFEFGIHDFDRYKMERIEKIFSKEIFVCLFAISDFLVDCFTVVN